MAAVDTGRHKEFVFGLERSERTRAETIQSILADLAMDFWAQTKKRPQMPIEITDRAFIQPVIDAGGEYIYQRKGDQPADVATFDSVAANLMRLVNVGVLELVGDPERDFMTSGEHYTALRVRIPDALREELGLNPETEEQEEE